MPELTAKQWSEVQAIWDGHAHASGSRQRLLLCEPRIYEGESHVPKIFKSDGDGPLRLKEIDQEHKNAKAEIAKNAYLKFGEILEQSTLKKYFTDDIKELQTSIAEAKKTGDFKKVENYLDNYIANGKSGIANEIIRIGDIEKATPLTVKGKLNNFGKNVIDALNDLLGKRID